MSLTIQVSQADMASIKSTLNGIQKDIDRALVYSINETLPGVRTDIVAELQSEINLPKSILLNGPGTTKKKPTFQIEKATTGNLSGSITTLGRNIPLVYYRTAPRQLTAGKHYRKMEIQVKKSRGKHRLRHVFIPKLRSGHLGFFTTIPGSISKRTGRVRIKELYGPRIPDIFSNKEPTQRVLTKVKERLDKNLDRAVNRVIANNK